MFVPFPMSGAFVEIRTHSRPRKDSQLCTHIIIASMFFFPQCLSYYSYSSIYNNNYEVCLFVCINGNNSLGKCFLITYFKFKSVCDHPNIGITNLSLMEMSEV